MLGKEIKLKEKLLDYFLINIYIITLFASSISNYSAESLYLKWGLSLVLSFTIIIHVKINNYLFTNFLIKKRRKFVTLTLILLFPMITLLYSNNAYFGILKWLSLITTVPTLLIGTIYFIKIWNTERTKILLNSLIFLTSLLTIFIIITNPFSYNSIFSLKIIRVSHVIAGRFLGITFLIFTFLLFQVSDEKKILLTGIFLGITGLSVYLTTLRASLVGLILILAVYFFLIYRHKKLKTLNVLAFISALMISFVFSMNLPSNYNWVKSRENTVFTITNVDQFSYRDDISLKPRLEVMNICFEQIKQNPFLGVGFGGFRSYYNSTTPLWMKYPHNIFLEFWLELGLIGFCFLLFFIFKAFSLSKKISVEFSLLLTFIFMLTIISKDIPSNGILWIWGSLLFVGETDFNREF